MDDHGAEKAGGGSFGSGEQRGGQERSPRHEGRFGLGNVIVGPDSGRPSTVPEVMWTPSQPGDGTNFGISDRLAVQGSGRIPWCRWWRGYWHQPGDELDLWTATRVAGPDSGRLFSRCGSQGSGVQRQLEPGLVAPTAQFLNQQRAAGQHEGRAFWSHEEARISGRS